MQCNALCWTVMHSTVCVCVHVGRSFPSLCAQNEKVGRGFGCWGECEYVVEKGERMCSKKLEECDYQVGEYQEGGRMRSRSLGGFTKHDQQILGFCWYWKSKPAVPSVYKSSSKFVIYKSTWLLKVGWRNYEVGWRIWSERVGERDRVYICEVPVGIERYVCVYIYVYIYVHVSFG